MKKKENYENGGTLIIDLLEDEPDIENKSLEITLDLLEVHTDETEGVYPFEIINEIQYEIRPEIDYEFIEIEEWNGTNINFNSNYSLPESLCVNGNNYNYTASYNKDEIIIESPYCNSTFQDNYNELYKYMEKRNIKNNGQDELPFISKDEYNKLIKYLKIHNSDLYASHEEYKLPEYLEISTNSIKRLNINEWYNDEIINSYIELISRHYQKESCFIFNTYFFPQLLKNNYDFKKLSTFLTKKNRGRCLIYNKYYIPIILNNHWSLIVIDTYDSSMIHYDSLSVEETDGGLNFTKELTPFFAELIGIFHWNYESKRKIPLQKGVNDCGVFLCQYIKYLVANKKMNFDHQDMTYFRVLIGIEIITGKLKQ